MSGVFRRVSRPRQRRRAIFYSLGAGAATSFPVVEGRTSGTVGSNTSTITPTFPSGYAVGDLLLVVLGIDGNSTWTVGGTSTAGWTYQSALYSTTLTGAIAWKFAESTSESLQLTTGGTAQDASWVTLRVSNASGVEWATQSASSSNAAPPLLTASYGDTNTLWLAAQIRDGAYSAPTLPTNYGNRTHQQGAAGGASVTTGEYELQAASQDPANFSTQTSGDLVAATIGIRPGAFPYTRAVAETLSASSTSLSVTLPRHIVGDSLLVFVAAQGETSVDTGSSSGGWLETGATVNSGSTYSSVYWLPYATSASSTLTLTHAGGGIAVVAYSIGGGGAINVYSATGTGTSVDPPSITQPSPATALYFAAGATGKTSAGQVTLTGGPSGYSTADTVESAGTSNQAVAAAFKATIATEDPGAFTSSVSLGWVAWGVAVQQLDPLSATLNQTLADFTTTASAAAPTNAAVSQTLVDFTTTASATHPTSATVSQTIDEFTTTASVALPANAAVSQTIEAFSQTTTAAAPANASVSQTIGDFTTTASAVLGVESGATLNQTIDPFFQTVTATAPADASVSQTIEAFNQTATATLPANASVDQTIGDFTTTATAVLVVPGESNASVNQTIGEFTTTASATHPASAAVNQTIGEFTTTASAVLVEFGSAVAALNQTLDDFQTTAAATAPASASVSQTIADFATTASAVLVEVGVSNAAVNQTIADFTTTASASLPASASVAQQVEDFITAAVAAVESRAEVSHTLPAFGTQALVVVSGAAWTYFEYVVPAEGVQMVVPADGIAWGAPPETVALEAT